MSKGERNLRLHIMVTHEELAAIRERMAEVNSQNQSAFIRKLARSQTRNERQRNNTTLAGFGERRGQKCP